MTYPPASTKGDCAESAQFVEPTPEGRRALRLRRLAQIAAVLALLALAYLAIGHARTLPRCEALPWVRGMFLAIFFIPAALGLYGMPTMWRMLQSEQWPLPGAPVFRRQRIERGGGVRRRARLYLAVCVVGVLTSVVCGTLLVGTPIFQAPPGSECARGGESNLVEDPGD